MNEDIEIVRGSGNVFRDFGHPNAYVEQTKAILTAKIIGVLDDKKLSTRQAEAATGVNHSEFVRIRRVKLDCFTIGRLISILNRLDQRVKVAVMVRVAAEKERASLDVRGKEAFASGQSILLDCLGEGVKGPLCIEEQPYWAEFCNTLPLSSKRRNDCFLNQRGRIISSCTCTGWLAKDRCNPCAPGAGEDDHW